MMIITAPRTASIAPNRVLPDSMRVLLLSSPLNSLPSTLMPSYAAIDIGSNSIRMAAAEVTPGEIPHTLAVDREVVRLGESVFRNGALSESAIALATSVLARMAATYQKLDVMGVRAVATAAVRDARNQEEFIQRASQA